MKSVTKQSIYTQNDVPTNQLKFLLSTNIDRHELKSFHSTSWD